MKSSLIIKITAFLMVAVTMVTLASCSLFGTGEDETTTTERPVVLLSERPETTEEVLAFFNSAVNNIKATKPALTYEKKGDIKDIETGDKKEVESLIKFAETFVEKLEKNGAGSAYGDDLNDVIPIKGTDKVSLLTPADIVSAECLDKEDDRFTYEINIALKDSETRDIVSKIFDIEINKEAVLEEFQDYTDTLEVSDYDVAYNGCTVRARINKETNEVTYMECEINSIVTTTVDFRGGLESLGETEISFNYQQKLELKDFNWQEPTEPASEE